MDKISFGKEAEKVAKNYLLAQNYKILENNYFNKKGYRLGEIDIVAKDKNDRIIFVEVKARAGKKETVLPEENISPLKIKKIIRAANQYLCDNKMLGCDWRIESVGIIFDQAQRKMHIRHLKNIRL